MSSEQKYYQISAGVELEENEFGLFTNKSTGQSSSVRKFTWRNNNNITVQVISYGATITAIKIPDKNGTVEDVVMGFNDMQGYLNPLNPYFGATVGRVANRIGYSKISIDGKEYNVSANLGQHQLHGGFKGFDKVNWDCYTTGTKVVMSYDSPDKEEGFPGNLLVNVSFQLNDRNEFCIDFRATTTKPTFVNLTNHSYFNLAGHNRGAEELYKHVITINADQTTDVDENSIPSGKLLPVADTIFDLQVPKVLGDVIHNIPGYSGYDHNFCVNKGTDQGNTFVAKVYHPPTGRVLEVYSNQPGVQFYTSNSIPQNPKDYKGDASKLQKLEGKGYTYYKHGALCLETQNWPDAINHTNFPKAALYPGETYKHTCTYKFWIKS